MSAHIRRALMVLVMSFAIAGCSVTGASSSASGGYWLVRVQANYANVYPYPRSMPPWQSGDRSHALYLGPTMGDARNHLSMAARQMGVPQQNISFVKP
jgi:hypothetical protein